MLRNITPWEVAALEDPRDFGLRVRNALAQAGETQASLAEAMDMDSSTVSNWCTGETKPGYFYIKALALALGCSANYLLGLSEEVLD